MSVIVENITKIFGVQKALDDVSFSIDNGEVVGFLGPNGAGKSTMMKIITGYLRPDNGVVKVCNQIVDGNSTEVRRLIGYLPEHNPLYLDMYVKEYLSMVAGIYGMNNIKERVSTIVEQTGLTPEQHKLIGALSKGYRQRVGIAQALISNPQVVILDEPTTGLDPNQIIEIRELIKKIGKERTVILSTHIMQEVEAVCDRVIVIDHGHKRADGSIDSIAQQTDKEFCINVEFASDIIVDELRKQFNQQNITKLSDKRFQIKSSSDIRTDIFKFATNNKLILTELHLEHNDMEHLFHQLTTN